ncbi:MAG: type II and III secretion system protein family protein [Alcaligenes sp.]
MKRYQRTTMICVLSAAAAMTYGVVSLAQTAAPATGANALVRDIAVAVKGQQSLMLDGATPRRIAIGDPEVADVKILPASGKRAGSLLIYGKKAGTTQLQIWTGNNAAPQIWNVRVASSVQAALASRGIDGGVNVDIAGDRAIVSGYSETPLAQIAAAQAAAAAVGDKNVVDVSTAGTGGVVQVEVKVVEVSRSVMKQAGINFAASNGPWGSTSAQPLSGLSSPLGFNRGGVLASGFSLFYDSNNFAASLRLLQRNGMERVLAEPTLVALTGQSASFLAGGELPIPEAGGLGTTTVTFKPFGIGLTVTPTVLSRDRISLKVAPEENTMIIPALRTRRADTTVELGDGESFVISGLVSRQTKAMVNKVPMLGDLPIIGAFFRSVDYTQEDTELVIVVTPRLVRPIARGVTLPLPGGRQEVSDSTFNAWGYYLMGPVGGQQMPGFSR